jgi:hypothetical protein
MPNVSDNPLLSAMTEEELEMQRQVAEIEAAYAKEAGEQIALQRENDQEMPEDEDTMQVSSDEEGAAQVTPSAVIDPATALVLHDAAPILPLDLTPTPSTQSSHGVSMKDLAALADLPPRATPTQPMTSFFSNLNLGGSLGATTSSSASASSPHSAMALSLGLEVDAQDCTGAWLHARVVKITDRKILIAFKGWGDKFVSRRVNTSA